MKKEEVPQDKSNLSKSNMKELCYATDENGNYTTALSSGWEPKTIALENSIQDINERVEEAKNDVKAGISSPIVYFMEVHKMDWNILASYVGMWVWRVKRHGKPTVFKKLNDKIMAKYAEAFEISVETLKNYKGD
ncbi:MULTISPECIES: hypothetical protein [Flavobacterium]|uniref:hypothetical protein n=1 Tax=Flavobacterium TaxID=237 RepID=UPI001FCB0C05|nr:MULTISPECIES: hypothetical protein [Flavobacterium]UOK42951.1 hypothetical protein LZF87_02240 [Flavobacterium enshiense]